jgi:hypothetical protein
VIVNGGDLTIVDNSPSKAGAITNDSDTDAKPSSVYVSNGGTLTLEDGTVSGYKCAIYCDENSSVKINGGKVIGKGSAGMAMAVYSGSTLEVNGGHIMSENTNSWSIMAKDSEKDYTITINDGVVEGTIASAGEGSLVVNGGSLSGYNAAIVSRKGSIEINGGNLSTTNTTPKTRGYLPQGNLDSLERAGAVIHIDAKANTASEVYIKITDGNLISQNFHTICITGDSRTSRVNNTINLTITGGSFTSREGYESVLYLNKVMGDINITETTGVTQLRK